MDKIYPNSFIGFCKRYFNLLLLFLFLLFVFRPYDKGWGYILIWQFCFVGVILSSIFGTPHSKSIRITACILAVPALTFNWVAHYYLLSSFEVAHLFLTFLFIFVCAASIIWNVILSAKVTLETLRGVICVYFMIAFGFAYLFAFIEYCNPGSFYFLEGVIKGPVYTMLNHHHLLAELVFYSFVTLLTIGYGNIHALADAAQTASIIEGTIGQFYIAILVARIIAVYSYYSSKQVPFSKEKDS